MIELYFHHQPSLFGVVRKGSNSGDPVLKLAPMDRLEGHKVGVFNTFINNVESFLIFDWLADTEQVSEVEVVAFSVPLAVRFMLLIHDGRVLRCDSHLELALLHFPVPVLVALNVQEVLDNS